MKACHFTNGKTLRDGRPIPPIGEWLIHDGPLELCASGLHASLHPFDALYYAPGHTLHLVEVGGKIVKGGDKLVSEKRRILQTIDAVPLLREFARMCALDVYRLWGNEKTDPDGAALRFLRTGDESLREAAWDAASAAASAAARAAARSKQRRRFARMVNAAFKAAGGSE